MNIIDVNDISKHFGDIHALKNVSFSVSEGEIAGYIGPNGSGKTTTIKAVTGLCNLDGGSVRILGEDALRDYGRIGRWVAVVFENHGLYANLTVWENLEFFARLGGLPVDIRKASIQRTLEMSGLLERSRSLTKTLSKGMLRKLAIGRALLTEPKIMILDEPFDGIDTESRSAIIGLLKTWVQQSEHCALLTSHNMYEVAELCSKVVVLKQGEVIASGSVDSLRTTTGKERIEIRLNEQYEYPTIKEAINGCDRIESFALDGPRLALIMDRQDVSHVSSLLYQKGIRFSEIVNQRENLNEIYLRLVGHHE